MQEVMTVFAGRNHIPQPISNATKIMIIGHTEKSDDTNKNAPYEVNTAGVGILNRSLFWAGNEPAERKFLYKTHFY